MIRRLFNFISAFSTALCIAVIVLSIRSYFVGDALDCESDFCGPFGLILARGHFSALGVLDTGSGAGWKGWRHIRGDPKKMQWGDRPMEYGFAWLRLGLAYASDHSERIRWLVILPGWLLAGVFAVPPAYWVRVNRRRLRRLQRSREKLCISCGYDLHASKGRCPECGSQISSTGETPP
jgi:hypothetical protein